MVTVQWALFSSAQLMAFGLLSCWRLSNSIVLPRVFVHAFVAKPHVPNRDVRTVTVRYEYMDRYTPNIYIFLFLYKYILKQYRPTIGICKQWLKPVTTSISWTISYREKTLTHLPRSTQNILLSNIQWYNRIRTLREDNNPQQSLT